MTTPILAELFVEYFNPTGNPGEYTFENARFNNQSDATGSGAYDIMVGMVLYVQATNGATAFPVTGITHRYRLTVVEVIDPGTISGTMIWDELGDEEDQPTSGAYCLLTEVTPNRKLGMLPSDQIYTDVPLGSTTAALRSDVKNILDHAAAPGGGVQSDRFVFVEQVNWSVAHNKGTSKLIVSTHDSDGRRFYAGEEIVDDNLFVIHCSEPTSGSVDVIYL